MTDSSTTANTSNNTNRPEITDQIGRTIFESVIEESADAEKAKVFFSEANEQRFGTLKEQHNAAYTYLALAFVVLEKDISIEEEGKALTSDKLLHFAGHAFREIGQMNRAADAYKRAGLMHGEDGFRIRSLARAKACYEDIGELEKSDELHRLEWEARNKGREGIQKTILSLWNLTSEYGTNLKRWLISLLVVVICFTFVYELMHGLGWIYQGQPWVTGITGFYYCIVTMTTLGYGEFVPTHPVSQCFVVFNVIVGYFMFAIGVTILGRKVIGR